MEHFYTRMVSGKEQVWVIAPAPEGETSVIDPKFPNSKFAKWLGAWPNIFDSGCSFPE